MTSVSIVLGDIVLSRPTRMRCVRAEGSTRSVGGGLSRRDLGVFVQGQQRGRGAEVTTGSVAKARRVASTNGSRARGATMACPTLCGASGNVSHPIPKRVCIMVEPSPFTYICGYMNRYRNTIKYLTELGCEVMVVTPGKGVCAPGADPSAFVDQPKEFEGAEVVETFSFSFPWYGNLPLSFGLSPRVYSKVKEFDPDVIHCSSPGVMWFAAFVYSRMLRKALLYSYHTHVPEYMPSYNFGAFLVPVMWSIIRFFHKAAHLVLSTSSVLADELASMDAPAKEGLDVWKKGVCSETFHPKYQCDIMRHRLTEGHDESPLLLSVGRLGSEKNLTFLRGILERHPKARLAFVGDGPAREELQAYFAGTNTYFAGMLRGEELAAAYASADVFLMPSESETLGFVVLEAMASGKPVVAVRAGGIPDILKKEGRTGFLYDSGDIETASGLVERLIEDVELRNAVGRNAREEVSNWDWRAATKHLLRVQYPAAIENSRRYYGVGGMLGKLVGGFASGSDRRSVVAE